IVQVLFILLGGWGTYKYFLSSENTRELAMYAVIYFCLFFGIFSAVSFDYHSNVIAATLVPWFFFFIRKRRHMMSSFLLFLLLISKENISLWVAFICLGLAFEYRKIYYLRNYLLICTGVSALYFWGITSVIMPMLSNSGTYPHFHYSALGNTMAEAVIFLFKHPVDALEILFTNHTGSLYGNYVKTELYTFLLISGLPLLTLRPGYLFMLIPIFFQKMFHDNYWIWGIGGQYSIEFAPVMTLGIFTVLGEIRQKKSLSLATIKTFAIIIVIFSLAVTIRSMDHTVLFTDKSRIRIYKTDHYRREYNVSAIYAQLEKIPDSAIVSAQSPFLPHLAYREKIYQFPVIKNAEYIIYSEKESPYPVDSLLFNHTVKALETSKEWMVLYKKEGFTILKRI
ncbi:MAG: DUF2079 domain-containing protein, partial [Crocinitomicaceae bacterium]|nr:DUF2079 domain-containing protein [Crocinitomicaceae bacterium]